MAKRPPGRPPKGPQGQKVSEFPVISLRVPPERRALIEALAFVKNAAVSELLDQAVEVYLRSLTATERRLAQDLAKKRQ